MPILTKLRICKKNGIPLELTQEDIIEILKNKEKLLKDCEAQKKKHMQEIKKITSEINELKNIKYACACTIRTEEEKLRNAHEEELVLVCEKETIINAVWLYFLRLPYDFRKILEDLYVYGKGWKYVEAELGIRKSKLCELRRKGVEQLMELSGTIWNQQGTIGTDGE